MESPNTNKSRTKKKPMIISLFFWIIRRIWKNNYKDKSIIIVIISHFYLFRNVISLLNLWVHFSSPFGTCIIWIFFCIIHTIHTRPHQIMLLFLFIYGLWFLKIFQVHLHPLLQFILKIILILTNLFLQPLSLLLDLCNLKIQIIDLLLQPSFLSIIFFIDIYELELIFLLFF